MSVTHINDGKLERYIRETIIGYLGDPPESEFQMGYLAACLDIYREGLDREGDDRIKLAAGLVYPDERA